MSLFLIDEALKKMKVKKADRDKLLDMVRAFARAHASRYSCGGF